MAEVAPDVDRRIDPDLKHVTVKDIRHCAATNMQRSGVPAVVREAILGHSAKRKTIESRYISISDAEITESRRYDDL
jgi:intergrase/recombinase